MASYYEVNSHVDWQSEQNHSLLNPAFPREQAEGLLNWLQEPLQDLKGHVFVLSSGTTAHSWESLKWVALSKKALLNSAAAVNHHLQSNSSDRWLLTLPSFHVGGLGIWARSHLSGATVHPMGRWQTEEFISALETRKITLTSLVPAQVFDLVSAEYRAPASLRAILVGGGALQKHLYHRALELGWPLLPTYGMTETCSQVATADFGNTGLKLLPHFEAQVDEQGRLGFRGTSLLTEYIVWKGDRAERVNPLQNGWFFSQDRGEIQNRILNVLGRSSDFVKIGGENVEMGRLHTIWEQILLDEKKEAHADTALLAVPNPRLGHQIEMIANSWVSETQAVRWIELFNQKVLGFEKIRKWTSVQNLPRTSLGKLIPSACLEMLKDL